MPNAMKTERPPADVLLQRARDLVPSLRERGERISLERRMPDDVLRDLHDAGLMELLRPRRYGGGEAGLDLMYRIGRELAKGDGSTSWVYVVTNSHDAFIGLYPGHVQDEYWSSNRPLSASSYAPTGKASCVSGGYRLAGKWSFCSGIDHSGWIVVGAMVGMLENPTRPDLRYFLVSSADYRVEDDWHVMGLRGTGSKSVLIDDLFVPDDRILTFQQVVSGAAPGIEVSDNPLYRESAWTSFGYCIAAPATGIARNAYDLLVKEFRLRLQQRDPIFAGKKPAVQMHLAEADALIESSDLLYTRSMEEAFASIAQGKRLTDAQRANGRRNQGYSVLAARKAGELLMGMAGGRSIAESNPIQRAFRDLYAVAAHPGANWDSPALSFGSVALGEAPTEMMI